MSIGETNTYSINVDMDVTDNGPDEAFSIDRRNIYVNGKHVTGQGLHGLEIAIFEALKAAAFLMALDDEWEATKPRWDSRDDRHDDYLKPGPVSKNGLG